MASDQVLQFSLASEYLAAAKERLLFEFPNALIGTKPLDDKTSLLWVTLYAVEPAAVERLMSALGADIPNIQNRPEDAPSLSDLVARVKRATGQL